jgi:cob(I)alamin adenosyltransferase
MSIVTKTGDKGETRVFDPKTKKLVAISKSSKKIETIGNIDELNSLLGVIAMPAGRQGGLTDIQSDLFTINAILAGTKLGFGKTKTKKLEKEIDRLEKILPVQKNFIYYGGDPKAALLFFARAVCRRAERSLVSLSKIHSTSPQVLIYLNRLSDYFFIKAREINFKSNLKEKAWMRNTSDIQ